VQGFTAAGTVGDWSYGASILTFAFPMILFVAVAGALYVLYTKPHLVPGHRYLHMDNRAAVDTAPVTPPGQTAAPDTGQPPATATGQEN
jgi:hypothetical protein